MNLSNNNSYIYTQVYTNYGNALQAYIEAEFGHGGKKKLAKMLADDPTDKSEVHSQQVNIGRWTNDNPKKRKEPLNSHKKKIHNSLNICISEERPGEWTISRTKQKPGGNKNSVTLDEYERRESNQSLEQQLDQIESVATDQGVSYSDLVPFLVSLEDHAQNFSKELAGFSALLRRLIEIEEGRSD